MHLCPFAKESSFGSKSQLGTKCWKKNYEGLHLNGKRKEKKKSDYILLKVHSVVF